MTKASLTLTTITKPGKYRPHRPHRHECTGLQDFLAGDIVAGYRLRAVGYRPFLRLPSAYRPPGNEPFCGAFSSPLVIAVGAVGILASFTDAL
jgi:hypothetical protein